MAALYEKKNSNNYFGTPCPLIRNSDVPKNSSQSGKPPRCLGQPTPAAADPEGAWYCFERGVSKTEGGQGWADVWMRVHFGWEYKGKPKDLKRRALPSDLERSYR